MKDPETTAVRQGEELNVEALARFLQGKIDGAESGVSIEQFPDGHSNLTYLLRAGECEYVLRRGPLGPVAPKAHDMAREFRVIQAVHPHFPEAPRTYLLCEDPSVIGVVFFLMERRHGMVLRDRVPPEIMAVPEHPRLASEAAVDAMVRLHAIDIADTGLGQLGKPEGFLERQVQGWGERWNRAKTEEMPEMDRVMRWLTERRPSSPPPTVVHNDYKLDNVMLQVEAGRGAVRVEAVLDWEMATIGDPLADLGTTLAYWVQSNDPQELQNLRWCPSTYAGSMTRRELAERYSARTGRDLSAMSFYLVLARFKIAVIVQQIYYRYHHGLTKDVRFAQMAEAVKTLLRASLYASQTPAI